MHVLASDPKLPWGCGDAPGSKDIPDEAGRYADLGIGLPTLAANFIPSDVEEFQWGPRDDLDSSSMASDGLPRAYCQLLNALLADRFAPNRVLAVEANGPHV